MLLQLTIGPFLSSVLLLLDDFLVVNEDPNLHCTRVQLVTLCHLAERIAHDRNDHIQCCDRRGERSQAEEVPAEDVELAVVVVVDLVVLAEREQILVDHHVDVFILDVVTDDLCSVVRLLVENEHGRTEAVQEDKEDAEERKDVLDRVVDERDILACIVEHSEPVKHLHPHDENDEGARRSLRDIIHQLDIQYLSHQKHKVCKELEQVSDVHQIGEVYPADMEDLQHFDSAQVDDQAAVHEAHDHHEKASFRSRIIIEDLEQEYLSKDHVDYVGDENLVDDIFLVPFPEHFEQSLDELGFIH